MLVLLLRKYSIDIIYMNIHGINLLTPLDLCKNAERRLCRQRTDGLFLLSVVLAQPFIDPLIRHFVARDVCPMKE